MESLAETPRTDPEVCNLQEDAHYVFTQGNWLRQKSNLSEVIFLRYLDYSIRRKKNDLLSHVRKIMFCQQNNRSDIIGQALTDLFLSLNDKGKQLKTSLLLTSKHLLSEKEYLALKNSTRKKNTDAIKSEKITSPSESSINTDNTDSIAQTITDSFVENGQLSEAMDYLENHLIKNNSNQQLAEVLSSIYKSCKESQRPISFAKRLTRIGKPIPDCLKDSTTSQ